LLARVLTIEMIFAKHAVLGFLSAESWHSMAYDVLLRNYSLTHLSVESFILFIKMHKGRLTTYNASRANKINVM